MKTISYSNIRTNLSKTMDAIIDNYEEVIVTRSRTKSVVMLSLENYQTLLETAKHTRK